MTQFANWCAIGKTVYYRSRLLAGNPPVEFPKKPPTDDQRRTEFLRLLEAPGFPRVYILGCFARYVTIYAQQVRALNLIDCLAKSGGLSERSRVAVVGGGIAGLTAAIAAYVRGVKSVVVLEKDTPLNVQRPSQQRYVHPHIYDWPTDNALIDDAQLPVLNWSAKIAAEMVGDLTKKWEEFQDHIETRLGSGKVEVWAGEPSPQIVRGPVRELFDVVILATGFGRDTREGTDNYWTDSRIDGPEATQEGAWLVSGGGDGALTDLMRLCIEGFRHKQVIEAVSEMARQQVGKDLLKAESEHLSPEELAVRYEQAAKTIAPHLKGKLKSRTIEKVWLNCSRLDLFQPNSSILNRLIVAWMLIEQRFEIVPHPGKINVQSIKDNPGVNVRFEQPGAAPLEVRHVIERHGPHPNTKFGANFPNIYSEACRELEAQWRTASQHEDWTKEPMFDVSEFRTGSERMLPLRVDFGDKIGCVVIGRGKEPDGTTLQMRIQLVLEEKFSLYERRAKLNVAKAPVHFSVTDVFANSGAYERIVRALCQSSIAIFDITGYEPAVMLLLGIRAAARRGVTLTVSADDPIAQRLPFNIRALNPIRLGEQDLDSELEEIGDALQSGFKAAKAQPSVYLDLPAYDALRRLGEDHRPLEPGEQILILRWFNKDYSKLVKGLVETRLKGRFASKTVVTTLDSRSPQLVEQRLYAAIRRTRLCISDWTGWRPNVLFETGVRLAINATDPIFIRCSEQPAGWKGEENPWLDKTPDTAELLERFFQPTAFTLRNDARLRSRIEAFAMDSTASEPGSILSGGRTYAVVKDAIDRKGEAGGTPVNELLVAQAKALVGAFEPGEGDSIPVVFAEALGQQASKAAMEHLLASWFYLNSRYGLLDESTKGVVSEESRVLYTNQLKEVWVSINSLRLKIQDTSFDNILLRLTRLMTKDVKR